MTELIRVYFIRKAAWIFEILIFPCLYNLIRIQNRFKMLHINSINYWSVCILICLWLAILSTLITGFVCHLHRFFSKLKIAHFELDSISGHLRKTRNPSRHESNTFEKITSKPMLENGIRFFKHKNDFNAKIPFHGLPQFR